MSRFFLPVSLLFLGLTACDKDSVEDLDADGYSAEEDCDDNNPDIFPGAEEICDGVDNDCNDEVDDGVLLTFYGDADGDGFGAPDQPVEACEATEGTAESDQDCDDNAADVYPGAPEDDCTDPVDYNCDGSVQYEDGDSDGWAACEDCDDANSDIHPDAEEVCDRLDNDCDGTVDGPDAADAVAFYLDSDEDGFGDPAIEAYDCLVPEGYSELDSDCDDTNAEVYPGAEEICDGLDTDCDTTTGELLFPTDYTNLQLAIDSGETEVCIEAGTHSVNLNLSGVDTLTLEGAGGSDAVFLDGGGSRVIDMGSGASNIELIGLTLQNANESGKDGLGVMANRCSNIHLSDIVVKDIAGDSGNEAGLALGFTQCSDVSIEESAVHSVTAAYTGTGGSTNFGLVGFAYTDNVEVDGLEIYDSSVSDFITVYGSALSFQGTSTEGATVAFNDVSIHDITESGTTNISYGMVLAMTATDVQMSNISVQEVSQQGTQVTSTIFVFQNPGDVDVHNIEVVGNTSTTTSVQYAPQFWEYASTGDVSISNIVAAGNTNVATGDTYADSVWFYNSGASSYDVQNLTIYGNTATNASSQGGGMLACNGTMTLRNSTISGNSADSGSSLAGVGSASSQDACVLTASYNNVYDNGVDFDSVSDFTGTDGNIGADPGFTDVSSTDPTAWDLSLASGSALIDAGDPAVLDADGSTSDIGAYGGPEGDSW